MFLSPRGAGTGFGIGFKGSGNRVSCMVLE